MTRIVFTVRDLVRVRLRVSLGPVAETVFALDSLGRNRGSQPRSGPPREWQDRLRTVLRGNPRAARAIAEASPESLLRLVDRGYPPDAVRRGPSRTELMEIWQLAVAPYWNRIATQLDADCAAWGRAALTNGVESMLSTLHSRIGWRAPVLEVPGAADEEILLGGRGLVLCPSLFLHHRPGVLVGARGAGSPVLVFPAPLDPAAAARIFSVPETPSRALAALVGPTRAAVLQVLTNTCNTTQLARRLGISSAGASHHTSVLRQTGLITTRRVRNATLHTVTPLGMALLGGEAG
ncbi:MULTISPECIES: ArsR/SmtB family transcription factor [Amycolatopsis]|uniref:ArsR/SmtB family transcription factor n=1 Tax=Amycolatopsis sp. cg13 TaxID=3238807 RepID=UPI003523144B